MDLYLVECVSSSGRYKGAVITRKLFRDQAAAEHFRDQRNSSGYLGATWHLVPVPLEDAGTWRETYQDQQQLSIPLGE